MTALRPADLADADRAAVMVMLLDDDQAAGLLSQLEPAELRLLGEKMCALGEIGPDVIAHAITTFVARTENLGLSAHDRLGQVKTIMTKAVGEVRADNLMERIAPDAKPPTALELARWLTPAALRPLLRDEHPQALAVLLVQLDPEVAAEVLADLPLKVQPEVVHRIATLGPVAPEALAMLDAMLERRIKERHGSAPLQMGGPRDAAELINNAGRGMDKRVLPEINKMDKALARAIENEMFKFEHLFVLDPQSMGALLREVESDVLIDALKGIEEDQRNVFFRAMSSRAADGVKDEIGARGRIKMADVLAAQKAVIAIARRLGAEGTIVFGSGGGDEDYV